MYRCFDELDDAIVISDRDNAVVHLNRSFQEIFDADGEAARGIEADDFVARILTPHFLERDDADRLLGSLLDRREVSNATCRLRVPGSGVRWFSFSRRVMTGHPYVGMVLTRIRDVTPERAEAVRSTWAVEAENLAGSAFTAFGELIPYGIWVCEPDGTLLYISPSFLDLAGKTFEECRRSGWLECIRLDDAATIRAGWRDCLDTGCRWDRELRILDSGKDCHIILSRGDPIRDNTGRIVLWIGINLDITARIQAEKIIVARAAQQEAIAHLGQFALAGAALPELMDVAVKTVAEHLGVEYAKVLRYLPEKNAFLLEAAVGFDDAHIGTKEVEGGIDSQAGYTLLSHEPVIVEDLRTEARFSGPPLLRDEGIVSGISVIIQGEREPYGVLGAHTRTCRRFTRDDINFVQAAANVLALGIKRKSAEEALATSEEKFHKIAQRSFDMIYTCYYDSGIAYISPAVIRILGYTPQELIGHRCRDYVAPLSLAAWEEGQKKIARGEPVEGLEIEFRRKDGSATFVELNESAILEHGKVVGVQVVGRDITERKQNEQMRRQAFEQIERNIEQFAVLGDHIRQPLQVTLGRAELLDDTEATAVIREQVERINEYIRQLDQGWVESQEVREFLRRHDLE